MLNSLLTSMVLVLSCSIGILISRVTTASQPTVSSGALLCCKESQTHCTVLYFIAEGRFYVLVSRVGVAEVLKMSVSCTQIEYHVLGVLPCRAADPRYEIYRGSEIVPSSRVLIYPLEAAPLKPPS